MYFLFLIVALVCSSQVSAGSCVSAIDTILKSLEARTGKSLLRLRIGPDRIYYSAREGYRYRDVYLEVKKTDNISDIAKILAQGGPSSEIEMLIRNHLKENPGEPVLLQKLLPQVARVRTNLTGECKSQDCLYAALKWYNFALITRFMDPNRHLEILEENYRLVPENENLQFGDLVIINNGEKFIHAAVYIGKNLIWHKKGQHWERPYTFESLENTIHSYVKPWMREANVKIYRSLYAPVQEKGYSYGPQKSLNTIIAEKIVSLKEADIPTGKIHIITSLTALGAVQALPELGRIIRRESEPEDVKKAAITALAAIGRDRAIPDLLWVLVNEKSYKMRFEAVGRLGRIGTLAAIDPVIYTLMNDPQYMVRQEATVALREIGIANKKVIAALELVIKHDSAVDVYAKMALKALLEKKP